MIALWMLAATVFALLLGVTALAAERVQRARRGATRGLWFAALVAAVLWPVLAPVLRGPETQASAPIGMATTTAATDAGARAPGVAMSWWRTVPHTVDAIGARAAQTITRVESAGLGGALLGAWVFASLVLLVRLGRAAAQLRAATQAGVRTVLDGESVRLSDTFGPATVGWRTPEIVLPAWVATLDAPLRGLVIAHERAHRDARDPRLLWAAAVATALVPWNVGVWWIARRLRLAVELDCDARTLAFITAAASPADVAHRRYARLLLFMAQHAPVSAGAPRFASTRLASAMASSRSHLQTRIRTMPQLLLDPASPRARRRRIAFGGVALLTAAAACGTHIPGNLTATTPVDAPVAAGVVVSAEAPGAKRGDMPIVETEGAPVPMPNGFRDSIGLARVDTVSVMHRVDPTSATHYFEFQVEQPAAMRGPANLVYPATLRSAQVEGTVLASFVVDPAGRPDLSTFKVLKSDHELFSNSVRDALGRMQYEPARVGGRAVRQLVQQPFAFSLARSATAAAPGAARDSVRVTAIVRDAPYFEFQVDKPAAMRGGTGMTYPPSLREARVTGTVIASFVVDENGRVEMGTFKVLRSDHALFTDAARAALPNMQFLPAEVGGVRVRQLVQQPFVFTLAK